MDPGDLEDHRLLPFEEDRHARTAGLRARGPGDLGGGARWHSPGHPSAGGMAPDRDRIPAGCRSRRIWRRSASRVAGPPARRCNPLQEPSTPRRLAPLRGAGLGPRVTARHGSCDGYRGRSVARGAQAATNAMDERRSRAVDLEPRHRGDCGVKRHPRVLWVLAALAGET